MATLEERIAALELKLGTLTPRRFPQGVDQVAVLSLLDKVLVGVNADGSAKVAAVNQIANLISATVGSGIEPTVEPDTTLPAPAQAGKIMIMKGGDYLQPDGVTPLVAPDNSFNVGYWDGTTWSVDISIETEADLSGYTTNDQFEPVQDTVSDLTVVSKNLIDTYTSVEAGYWLSSGFAQSSNNWIRTPYLDIPIELLGQQVTVSGGGAVPSSAALCLFRDESGSTMTGEIIPSGGGNPYPYTFTVPLDARKWAFTIANDSSNGGVGTRPFDNIYTDRFQVEAGDTATSHVPYGKMVSPQRINDSDSIRFGNEITEDGDGAVPSRVLYPIKSALENITVPSKNLVDMSTNVEAGSWNTEGFSVASNNWIRTPYLDIPIELLGQQVTVSGGGAVPSSAALCLFRDESDSTMTGEIIPSGGGNPYPYTFTVPLDARKWAFTIANDASDGGIGTRPFDNTFTDRFQVEAGDTATPPIPVWETFVDGRKVLNESTRFDVNEIILKKVNSEICHIYFHIGGANDLWFRINLLHQVNAEKFIDVWRLDEGWIVTRVNDATFVNVQQCILTGVYENAIYTSSGGYSDALGSAHGWEELDTNGFQIFMDAAPIDMNTVTIAKGRSLRFSTRTFFKTSDGLADIGISFKMWDFKDGIFIVKNNIQWLGELGIGGASGNSYLSMCSVIRETGGNQITHTAYSNDDGTPYDVSETGFSTPIHTNQNDPRRNLVIVWGDFFRAEMLVSKRKVTLADGTILSQGLPNAGIYVQNTGSPNYNKIYGKFGSTTVQNGDFWEVETVYRLANI